jgi:8-oxo-dGTP diphosphatase
VSSSEPPLAVASSGRSDRAPIRRARAAVVLRDESRIALIRRVRDGRTYFVFPGGGIHAGETPAEAAEREAHEELGVRVVLGPRLLIEEFRGQTVHYYSALIVGGDFGTGTGDELRRSGTTERGTYEPVWMEIRDLLRYDVRPRSLAAILTGG